MFVRIGFAQDYLPAERDIAYVKYRAKVTVPPYGLAKVNKEIKEARDKIMDYDDGSILGISSKNFKALSLREKFTYCMIYPEVYSQNCDVYVPKEDEESKIFSQTMSWMNEVSWSERQLIFMRENRDSVMGLIRESTLRSKRMGANYKETIVELNAWEMIPFVIQYFQGNRKDKDALTVLLLLMKKGEYDEFMRSATYRKLYGKESNYESFINYSIANEELIINRARGYYEEKIK